MSDLTSGQLAEGAGVGIETIRYYERKGLLPPPARSRSGYRRFPAESVDRLRSIRQAQHLGFSLKEIQELLSLRIDPKASCSEVRQRAQAKIDEIEQRLRGLQRIREVLWRLIEACGGRGPTAACPILEALEASENDDRVDKRKKKSRKVRKMNHKRKVEVFTAGCPACEKTVGLVQRLACPSCEIAVLDMKDKLVASRAEFIGIRTVPAVAIDGQLAECCARKGPEEASLRAGGLGQPIK